MQPGKVGGSVTFRDASAETACDSTCMVALYIDRFSTLTGYGKLNLWLLSPSCNVWLVSRILWAIYGIAAARVVKRPALCVYRCSRPIHFDREQDGNLEFVFARHKDPSGGTVIYVLTCCRLACNQQTEMSRNGLPPISLPLNPAGQLQSKTYLICCLYHCVTKCSLV